MEKGKRKYLDNNTLHLLAKCSNLTSLEKLEFMLAAVFAELNGASANRVKSLADWPEKSLVRNTTEPQE
ncbi:MAG: hypothetical protein AVO34_02930 [Firmicutes bacterium ML8_F2]|nr:MAG: hypothetical protein AVO34_02930 [Firmicutes bacterium ML8_F2]